MDTQTPLVTTIDNYTQTECAVLVETASQACDPSMGLIGNESAPSSLPLSNRVKDLENTLANEKDKLKKLEDDVVSLDHVNREMIDSIRQLEMDNRMLRCEGRISNVRVTQPSSSTKRRKQILIIGDRNISGFASLFKKYTGNQYDINSQQSVKSLFDNVANACVVYSKRLTRDDYVILLWGPETAIKGGNVSEQSLQLIFDACRDTNLIMLGSPLFTDRPVLNQLIGNQNISITTLLAASSARHHFFPLFLPLSAITTRGILYYSQKCNLIKHISSNVIMSSRQLGSKMGSTEQGRFFREWE